jgi:hypothetical protein
MTSEEVGYGQQRILLAVWRKEAVDVSFQYRRYRRDDGVLGKSRGQQPQDRR